MGELQTFILEQFYPEFCYGVDIVLKSGVWVKTLNWVNVQTNFQPFWTFNSLQIYSILWEAQELQQLMEQIILMWLRNIGPARLDQNYG